MENCKDAQEGWTALERAFEDRGTVRKVTLLKQWISLKFSYCSSMQEYVNQCLSLRSKVKNAGFNIKEEIAASIMLCSLSEEFKSLVMSIETKTLTVDYVTHYLLQKIEFSNNDTEKALVTQKKSNNKQKQKKRGVKCYKCGGPHFRHKCPELKNKTKSENCDLVLYSSFIAQNTSNNDWFIDSGATAHMTSSDSFLINKSEPKVSEVAVANNKKLKIKAFGDIKHNIMCNNEQKQIIFKDVQHVPGLSVNLISVSQMVNRGCEVFFYKNGCKIFKNDKLIASGTLINNMFKLNINSNINSSANSTTQCNAMAQETRSC